MDKASASGARGMRFESGAALSMSPATCKIPRSAEYRRPARHFVGFGVGSGRPRYAKPHKVPNIGARPGRPARQYILLGPMEAQCC